MSDNLEPGTCSTPPGAGAVPRRDYACGAILLGGACKMWPESDGCPTHGVSCPVVPSPTPPGAGADLLARLLECVGRYGMDCAETKQLAPRYELTEAANAIVTELRRLAAEVERLWEELTATESARALYVRIVEDVAAAVGNPERGNMGSSWSDLGDKVRATSQAAAEQMRVAMIQRMRSMGITVLGRQDDRVRWSLDDFAKDSENWASEQPHPDLNAIREAAYDDGYAEGATDCDNVLTSMMNERVAKAERRGAERALAYVHGLAVKLIHCIADSWRTASVPEVVRKEFEDRANVLEAAARIVEDNVDFRSENCLATLFPAAPEVERA